MNLLVREIVRTLTDLCLAFKVMEIRQNSKQCLPVPFFSFVSVD